MARKTRSFAQIKPQVPLGAQREPQVSLCTLLSSPCEERQDGELFSPSTLICTDEEPVCVCVQRV